MAWWTTPRMQLAILGTWIALSAWFIVGGEVSPSDIFWILLMSLFFAAILVSLAKLLLEMVFAKEYDVHEQVQAYPSPCPGCNREVIFTAIHGTVNYAFLRQMVWPLEEQRFLQCPSCGYNFVITPEEFDRARGLGESTEAYRQYDLSEEEYRRDLFEFERDVDFTPEPTHGPDGLPLGETGEDTPGEPPEEPEDASRGFY